MSNIQNELMLEILLAVQNGNREVFSKLGDANFDTTLEQIVSKELIQGLQPTRMASGTLTLEIANNFGLTEKGVQFITDRNPYNHR
ncbi:hypothetical protein P9B03_04120 [Metasolibacillus meyeri]|uniref:Uncharacterized protein n=1 Tax=Metasolibacillus meyeri TaxID=1071052 RepID=A0AAW9NS73_9BACL|nr:hypothetical protein [Metasolibacillus meyeri]MEC1177661.1 hypothetical protein [Metasolibacillus meyeri]